ncbi:MAG: hypothetical protein HY720_23310 [Planctomycetes bacterium]|nr:hypothetical protein [Planctomycetota bacterium]
MPLDPRTPERPFALNFSLSQPQYYARGSHLPDPEDQQAKKWWQSFTKPPKGTYGTDYPIYTW